MVNLNISTSRDLKGTVDVALAEAPEFEKVTWYSNSGLRRLYFWAAVLCVASATTGYDGYASRSKPAFERLRANTISSNTE